MTSLDSSTPSIIQRVDQLAKPRPFGSAGEARARKAVAEALAEAGWEVAEEPFSARWTIDSVAPLGIAAATFLLIIATVSVAVYPALAVLAACGYLILAALLDPLAEVILRYGLSTGRAGGPGTRGTNLRATHPNLRGPGPSLWIVAHLDAKRQRIPLVVRCAVALLSRVLGAAAAVAVVGYILAPHPLVLTTLRASFALAAMGAVVLLINASYGDTDGAVDNAGSLTALVEISRRLPSWAEGGHALRVELVATAGEEAGCLGAMALALGLSQRSETPLVLNLEALGAGPRLLLIAPPYKSPSGEAGSLLTQATTEAASGCGVNCFRWRKAPGFWADHQPFRRVGCEAATLAGVGRGLVSIHTRWDRSQRLDAHALERHLEVILAAVARLAESENGLANRPNM